MADRRRLARVAALLWAGLTLVVWNALFDHAIDSAVKHYLVRQALHVSGRGPAVKVNEVMQPAAADGALKATLGAVLVAAVGVAGFRIAARIRDPI